MGRPKGSLKSEPPKYQLHASGQAKVRIAGRDHYLGVHGSRSSWEKYHRLCAELVIRGGAAPDVGKAEITIDEVCAAFWTYAIKRYGQARCDREWKFAIKPLRELYGSLPAADFGPLRLQTVRETLIRRRCGTKHREHLTLSRNRVNGLVKDIRQIFKWAAARELIPGSVHHALTAVRSLAENESDARETRPPTDVDDAVVEATLPYLLPQVATMVKLQRLTGMRPGEVVIMRGVDIDTTRSVWTYVPSKHKNQHKGKDRVVKIGPDAQAVLRPFLKAELASYLFTPAEAMAAFFQRLTTNGKYAGSEWAKRRREICQRWRKKHGYGRPRYNPFYTTTGYRQTIYRAADQADAAAHAARPDVPANVRLVPRWHPHQLRHSFATAADRQTDNIQVVSRLLGHASVEMTRRYVHDRRDDLDSVVAKIG